MAHVELEVRELIRRSGVDPAREGRAVRDLVRDVVADYDERSLSGGLPSLADPVDAVDRVWDAVAGFGVLQRYLDDPRIEEIWINEPGKIFVARDGVAELTTTILTESLLCSSQALGGAVHAFQTPGFRLEGGAEHDARDVVDRPRSRDDGSSCRC